MKARERNLVSLLSEAAELAREESEFHSDYCPTSWNKDGGCNCMTGPWREWLSRAEEALRKAGTKS